MASARLPTQPTTPNFRTGGSAVSVSSGAAPQRGWILRGGCSGWAGIDSHRPSSLHARALEPGSVSVTFGGQRDVSTQAVFWAEKTSRSGTSPRISKASMIGFLSILSRLGAPLALVGAPLAALCAAGGLPFHSKTFTPALFP